MDEVEQVKERLDIVEVISSYLTLKKAGVNMKANCPFHHEKSPSFMVSPERQTFHCFGCNEGGDIFTFIEKMEGVDFYNALKILADKAGVELKKGETVKFGSKEFKSDVKTRLYEINDWTKKFYHKILVEHPKAEKARSYVYKTRRLTEKTVNDFEIGYAPQSWDLLIKFLGNKGYKKEELFQAGVVVRNEKGDYYDRFRGRIVFPINNIMGATIAFTSRILEKDDKQPKYINSSESPIYIKGKTIYGLDKAKLHIKENSQVVVVEGNMDVIACHQAGFCNVVATSGTALTTEQLRILNRYAGEIAFSFDSDLAGEAAMKKAIRLALSVDINAKIISLPGPFKDPDEAISADSKHWQRSVELARPALEFWIDLLIRKEPSLEISTKKSVAKEILPVIKSIFSEIEKEYYIKYLSKKLAVSEKSLYHVLEKTKIEERDRFVSTDKNNVENKLTTADNFIGLSWARSNLVPDVINEVTEVDKTQFSTYTYFDLQTGCFDKSKMSPADIAKLDQLAMTATKNIDITDDLKVKNELLFLIKRIQSDQKENLKENFARKIQLAEEAGDKKKVQELLKEFSSLIK